MGFSVVRFSSFVLAALAAGCAYDWTVPPAGGGGAGAGGTPAGLGGAGGGATAGMGGAAGGGTGGTGGAECVAEKGDDDCTQCAKESCCAIFLACEMDAQCSCWLDCYEAGDCTGAGCMAQAPPTTTLFGCLATSCILGGQCDAPPTG
jgi:hypothetical protein